MELMQSVNFGPRPKEFFFVTNGPDCYWNVVLSGSAICRRCDPYVMIFRVAERLVILQLCHVVLLMKSIGSVYFIGPYNLGSSWQILLIRSNLLKFIKLHKYAGLLKRPWSPLMWKCSVWDWLMGGSFFFQPCVFGDVPAIGGLEKA